MALLQELVLELTDFCPLRCIHCSTCASPECRSELKRDVVETLIADASGLGARKVSLGGGEPTASALLLPVVDGALRRGMSVEVFTSGVSGNGLEPISDDCVAALSGKSQLKLIFSIHSAWASLHDMVADTPGSFSCMQRSLMKCLDAGIECEANYVPLKPTSPGIRRLVNHCLDLGVGGLSVLRFVAQGRGHDSQHKLQLATEEEAELLCVLKDLQDSTPMNIRLGSPFNHLIERPGGPCRAGGGKIVVQADANVIPCEAYKDSGRSDWGLSAASLSLHSILHSRQLVEFRARLRAGGRHRCPVHAGGLSEEARRDGRSAVVFG